VEGAGACGTSLPSAEAAQHLHQPSCKEVMRRFRTGHLFNYSNETMHEVMAQMRFGSNDRTTMQVSGVGNQL
jgi:hypothetical protein